jgi:hypothetical protein
LSTLELPAAPCVIIFDDATAIALAKKTGLYARLMALPDGINKVATIIGPDYDSLVLAVRFYGFADPVDNGFMAIRSRDRAALRASAQEIHEFGRGAVKRRDR